VFLVLLQVLVLLTTSMERVYHPYVYVLFILLLPYETPSAVVGVGFVNRPYDRHVRNHQRHHAAANSTDGILHARAF